MRCSWQLDLKMKDRLDELKNRISQDDSLEFDEHFAFDNPAFQENEKNDMDSFFQEISALSLALRKLREMSETIENKQEEVLCSTSETSICEGKKKLSQMKNTLSSEAKVIQSQLTKMKESLDQDNRIWLAEHRIRQSQFTVLTNKYRDIVTQHYIKETKYMGKLKEKIKRQTELAGLNLQEEEIDQIIGSAMVPQIVGMDLEILKAKQNLAMAQERHKQLMDLEGQITELHTIFLQLEILVLEQQDIINNIEYNVLNAMDYISQSTAEVKKALKYEKQSRTAAVISALLGLCACCTCLSCISGAVR
ncbi:syntaxin-3-like [Bombina bombina]|uniref:syntaxin-3-like n=1 Tax=Bombina bombina TaxID=8345 RepID=UPI00235AC601|nr:syntaxin-3-like [Bombina bombina]